MRLSDLRTNGTPTLILTAADGTVKKFWRGKLSAEKEADVLNTIDSGGLVSEFENTQKVHDRSGLVFGIACGWSKWS